jgi:hypothetical protein
MTTLAFDMKPPIATHVVITDESLIVDLADGRTISVPIAWYPRLLNAGAEERNNWRFIGSGEGIHWPELDEDLSVENLLLGKPSGESPQSFERWLQKRQEHRPDTSA